MRAKLLAFIGAALLAGVASANTVDCSTLSTLSAMQAQFTGGGFCQIGDVLITGLNTTNITGGQASTIQVSVNNNPPTNSNSAERGLNFNGQGGWGSGTTFSITFTGTLCYTGHANCGSTNGFVANAATLLDEGQAAQTNPAGSGVTTTNSITPTGQSALSLNANGGLSGAGSTTVQFFPGTTGFSLTLSDNGQGNLNTIEGDVEEVVGPEPGTMMLMGGALLGLATAGRKLRKKS
jgi:hypothetical protein